MGLDSETTQSWDDAYHTLWEQEINWTIGKLKDKIVEKERKGVRSKRGFFQIKKEVSFDLSHLDLMKGHPNIENKFLIDLNLEWNRKKDQANLDATFKLFYGNQIAPKDRPELMVDVSASINLETFKFSTESDLMEFKKEVEYDSCNTYFRLPISSVDDIPLQSDGNLTMRFVIKLVRSLPKFAVASSQFRKNASSQFGSLLEDMDGLALADVKIITKDNQEIKAHKFPLIARSEVLRKMLTTEMEEKQLGLIMMDDISSSGVKHLLRYMYAGEVPPFSINKKDGELPCISELVYAADKYMLHDLKDFFDKIIGDWIQRWNYIFLTELATKYSLKKARSDCDKFFQNASSDLEFISMVNDHICSHQFNF